LERAIRYALEKSRHARDLELTVAARTAELEKAIQAQGASEEYLRLMLDSTEQAFYGIDRDGHTTICNSAFVRMMGFARVEDVIGQKLHDVIHHTRANGANYPVAQCPIYLTAQTGQACHVDDECFYPLQGEAIPVEYWSYPVYREGELRGAITTCIDITERKEAEAKVREAGERFRFLAESMPQKIFTAKTSGEVDYFNREWMQFTGLTFEQIRDWGWLQFIHPADTDETVRQWQNAVATNQPFNIEHRFRRADGEYHWHLSRALPMRDAGGEVTMWIGSNTDIEDQKNHEAELRESEARARRLFETAEAARISAEAAKSRAESATRAKDDFLAALSHELRTPLNPALLLATSLAGDAELPARVRSDIDVIAKGIALQAELVDDLLDITRITGGKLRLELRPIDAHIALRNAYEIVRSDAEERELEITFNLAAKHNCIEADAVRLQQIFWNVLKNAVKFTARGGAISVTTCNAEDNPGALTVEITDTGIGIAPEMLGTVFDAFIQEEHDRGHRFGGIGLGLAITRRLVELQHGRIEALSAGRGKGATFRIEFPLESAELCAEAEPTPVAPTAVAPITRRILLVEDHEQTRLTLAQLLERRGHIVTAVETTAAARENAASGEHDLVISDLGLPDGDGHKLMADLRAAHRLPGIALSGYGMDDDIARSRQSGFYVHLTKPIDIASLEAAIAAAPPKKKIAGAGLPGAK
ncbi:MAG: PAS domain S-box protein, partial [Chthoniobacterales bacterium]